MTRETKPGAVLAMRPIRLTAILTHPVQYYAPWFRHIAARCRDIDLTVLYATQPTAEQQGAGFGQPFQWDVPLTDGYRCRVLRPSRPGESVQSDRFWGLDVPEIGSAIRESRPHVALIPGWHSVTLARALWACRRQGIPTLYRGDTNLGTAPTDWRRWPWRLRTRLLLGRFDGYLCVGHHARAYLRRFGARDSLIWDAPHCIDTEFFGRAAATHQTPEARQAARAAFGLPRSAFVVLCAGKLEPKKRPLDLVRAIARMDPPVSLLMVGAGELEAECRAEARKLGVELHWAGFLNQTQLGRVYAAADCLALPSDWGETWGLVVNEALASGLPCVVSDRVGCAPDLITPGETGEAFAAGDVAALARSLERVRARLRAGWRYLRTADGPPVLAMAFTFQWAQITMGVYYHALTGRSLDTMDLSDYRPMVLIGLGCLVALLLGLVLGMKVLVSPRPSGDPRLANAFTWSTLLAVYVGTTIATGTIQSFAWEVPALTQAILALTYARLATLFMIFRRLTYPRIRWGWIAVILLCEIPLGFTGFFAGFREPIMLAAVALLGVFNRRSVKHWIVLGVLAVPMLFTGVLWMAIRQDFRHDFESQVFAESREARLKRITALTGAWLNNDHTELFEDVDKFVDRLWVVYYPALAVSRVPQVLPHTNGVILGRALTNLVMPRFLFPDKGEVISDSEMVTQYSGVWVAGAKEGTNIAFGYAAESYVDLGGPLMFRPVLVYGFLIGMAYHWWLGAIRHRDLAVGLATVMFWLCLYIFERSWVKTLGLTVTMMVYLGGLTLVLDRALLWHSGGSRSTRPRRAGRRRLGR